MIFVLFHFLFMTSGLIGIILANRYLSRRNAILVCTIISCIALMLTSVIDDPSYLFSDFRLAYRPAGDIILQDRTKFVDLYSNGVSGYVNIPIIAVIFAPFSAIPLFFSLLIFLILGILTVVISYFLIARVSNLNEGGKRMLILLFTGSGPLIYSLKEGNTSQWVLLALAAGLLLLHERRSIAAGIIIGVSALLKLPLLLFAVYFILTKNIRALTGFTAACLIVVALSIVIFGIPLHIVWFEKCVLEFNIKWLSAFNVQSIAAFILRSNGDVANFYSWSGVIPTRLQRITANVSEIIVFIIVSSSIVVSRAKYSVSLCNVRRTSLEYTMIVCALLVLSPVSWSHYYCWLLIPTALHLAIPSFFGEGPIVRIVGWSATLISTLPILPVHVPASPLAEICARIAVSLPLFAALLWLGLCVRALMSPATLPPPLVGQV